MIRRIATVGGLTLVSRLSGFIRDVVMAAILGAGPVADAFFVAFRLPNHFRAIFAEGAFAAAFVPAYAHTLEKAGLPAAKVFADQVGAALIAINLVLLAIALLFTPDVVMLLAPGLSDDPQRFDLAVALTRITFPYLALVSLETLFAGILNANNRFASAAGASILLNVSLIATLALAPYFESAGHAAAWGVLIAGVAMVLFVGGDAEMHGYGIRLRMPRLDEPTKRFLKALGPAIIGAGGVQLALFADTVIASFLPAGALSALYYADRINQLPIGVVGIAVGTVLLPEMSRRLAAGDIKGAASAQARGIQLALLLTLPCAAAAVAIPDLIMRALFARGAFTSEDALSAGHTLAAYSLGLIPFVLLRSFTAPFYAREGRAAGRRREHRAEGGSDEPSGPSGSCAGDQHRRLDQSGPARGLGAPPRLCRVRRGHSRSRGEARRDRHRVRRGNLFRRPMAPHRLVRYGQLPRGDDTRHSRRGGRHPLFRCCVLGSRTGLVRRSHEGDRARGLAAPAGQARPH
jgi:putative peptidoglycan lipid II flippase